MTTTSSEHARRVLSRAQIEARLPHRGAMLLVDRVVDVRPRRVTGELDVTTGAFWTAGHFPGMPVLPGVLQVEFAAQLAGVALGELDAAEPDRPFGLGVLASIRRVSFRHTVVPDAVLRGDVRITESSPSMSSCTFSLSVGRDVVADGALTVALAHLDAVASTSTHQEVP